MAGPDEMPPPPEATLLRRARESRQPRKMSMRAAALAAGVSETTWRHAEAGSEPRGAMRFPYRVTDGTLARMARVTGISPGALEAAGRPEAAAILAEMQKTPAEPPRIQRLSDVVPECAFERNILATDRASDEAKLDMINGHRLAGHSSWCRDQAASSAEDSTAASLTA